MRHVFVLLCLTLLFAAPAQALPPYRGGAVSTAHPRATRAALAMLDRGGNAVDAAVAAAFVLAVVGPYHSGLGGGGFALWYDTSKHRGHALDFRETAPQAATRDMYVKDGRVVRELAQDGALGVAVPGAVAGYLTLQRESGKLSRKDVLAPAIQAAKEGFLITPLYHRYATDRRDCLREDADAARIFLRPNAAGEPDVPPLGTLLKQPDLARTLTAIAAQGERAFYEGPVARAIATSVQQDGGVLTVADLAAYRVRPREPLPGTYRGHRILTFPPPSGGGVILLQTLGVMERLEPKGFAFHDAQALHFFTEALRRAYFDRARFLGDPDFIDVPLQRLLSAEHLDELARSIDPAHATPSASLGTLPRAPEPMPQNTTHLSVVDRDGNAVALTTTINYQFGSCVVARGTGVLLNDEMDDFAAGIGVPNAFGLVSGEANTIAPGKVPLSSMTPTIVFQREDAEAVRLVVGSPGGSTIPTSVLQVLINVIDGGMDVERAIGAGRVHHQYLPDELRLDAWAAEPETIRVLQSKGHIFRREQSWGAVHAVAVDPVTGMRSAAADPRTEGLALGQE